jgi:hypothetical protein
MGIPKLKMEFNFPRLKSNSYVYIEWPPAKQKTAALNLRMALDMEFQNIVSRTAVKRVLLHSMVSASVACQSHDLL